MEEKSDESAKWSGEETEELTSEKEDETVGGAEEAGSPLMETAGESEESGTEDDPGGVEAGEGATANATSADAAKAGARGPHEARSKVRERVAGCWYR